MKTSSIILTLSALTATFVAAQTPHQSGGAEHIVIIDNKHPTPPAVAEVLQRLELNESHPDVRYVFNNSAFRGFAASMKSHCLDLLANMSDITVVEQAVTVSHASVIPSEKRASATEWDTRDYAPWGLQRISTASFPSGNLDPKNLDFTYSYSNEGLGEGADIYIVDTGLYADHYVFGGRAQQIWTYDGNQSVVDGHGTHVAGTAGGADLGVASNANVFGVKALGDNGCGLSSNVVAGIDFVIQNHDLRKANASQNGHKGSVLSMSLASGIVVSAIDQALAAAITSGVHVTVAAGNSNVDACTNSPSASGGLRGGAITVGSVGMTAKRSSFSNYGDCVDVYAPGEDIVSAWLGGPNNVNVLSGTSMATPHVAGIVAYAMANSTLANDPGLMKEWIRMQAITLPDGTLLANNGVLGNSPPSTTPGMIGFSRRRAYTNIESSDKLARRGISPSGLQSIANWFIEHFGGKKHHRRSELNLSEADTNALRLSFSQYLSSLNSTAEINKRAVSASGLQSLFNWFIGLFKKHRKRSEVLSGAEVRRRSVCEGFSECFMLEEPVLVKRHRIGQAFIDAGNAIKGAAENAGAKIKGAAQSAWNWLKGIFHHNHKRSLPVERRSVCNGLHACEWVDEAAPVIEKRAISPSGLQSLFNWFIGLFHKHHKRSEGLDFLSGRELGRRAVSASGLQSLFNWFIGLFKKHHKRSYFDVSVEQEFDELLAARRFDFVNAEQPNSTVQYRRLIRRSLNK